MFYLLVCWLFAGAEPRESEVKRRGGMENLNSAATAAAAVDADAGKAGGDHLRTKFFFFWRAEEGAADERAAVVCNVMGAKAAATAAFALN